MRDQKSVFAAIESLRFRVLLLLSTAPRIYVRLSSLSADFELCSGESSFVSNISLICSGYIVTIRKVSASVLVVKH